MLKFAAPIFQPSMHIFLSVFHLYNSFAMAIALYAIIIKSLLKGGQWGKFSNMGKTLEHLHPKG